MKTIALFLYLGSVALSFAAAKPNVIFLLTDDQGWGDAAAWGHPYYKTPNLDRLTKEGRRISQFYVANPVCSPSRTAFMTGQFPARHGVHGHFADHQQNAARSMSDWLSPQAPLLTRQMKAAGYATGHFGKWHLGAGEGAPLPSAYGVDESATVVSNESKLRDPASPPEAHWWGKSTGVIMDHALGFIRSHQDEPFYLNIWTLVPHATLDPTPEQLAVYQDLKPDASHPAFGPLTQKYYQQAKDLRSQMQVFAASITDLDSQVGRLLDTLKELGIDDNTLLVYSSDNGPEDYNIGNASNGGVGSPGPLRGRKRSIYEGGVRTPLIVRWPGKVQAGVFDETTVMGGVDLLPTICSITGTALPEVSALDGEDVSDLWLGKSRARQKPLFWEWRFSLANGGLPEFTPPSLAMREGPWKLLLSHDQQRVELYDIPADKAETHNLAAQHPEIVQRMSQSLLQWQKTLPPLKHPIGTNPSSSKPKATKGKAPPAETDRAAMFKRVDRDHNGLITRAEHLLNFKGREAEGKSRFDGFDANHDDQLTPEEFIGRGGVK
jgi:N-acetylgalactosamine-6-sulfatase